MRKIILASGSPRRFELMKLLNLPFEKVVSNFDEDSVKHSDPAKFVEQLSYEKANVVAKNHKDGIIIGADTVVVLDGQILGKPKDKKDAKRMLKLLSASTHTIITGLTVMDSSSGKKITKSVSSSVKMRKITDAEIDLYVKTGEPMDKAGGYAVQERGGLFVDEMRGDFFSIVGLPLKDLQKILQDFGVIMS